MFVNPCFEPQNEIVSVLIELANSLHASNIRQLLLDVAKFWQQAAGKLGVAELRERDVRQRSAAWVTHALCLIPHSPILPQSRNAGSQY